MKPPALSDKDAHVALELADAETRDRYNELRSRMRSKLKVSAQDRHFIKNIRSTGRKLDQERKNEAYDRLFT